MESNMDYILCHWDIGYDNITELQNNVWSIDDNYILKASENKEWIRNLLLYRELKNNGIPAPDIVSTSNGETYYLHGNLYYFMLHKIKGKHLSVEEVLNNPETAVMLGKTIAKLHRAFAVITEKFKLEDMNFISELEGWIKNSLDNNAADAFTNTIFYDCLSELKKIYCKLDRHIIHRDMHLGNLLFEDNEISGYIDFDLTQVNARIFDIAYILAGWIVGKVDDQEYLIKWKLAVRSVICGYQEEQELYLFEIKSLVLMMCCIEILFVAYFLNVKDMVNSSKAEGCLKWLWMKRDEILR